MSHFAVVGGSIAGSIASILLRRSGHTIKVFERSANLHLPDRGAGIWMPKNLIDLLISKKILSPNFASLSISNRPIYLYDSKTQTEKLLTNHKIEAAAVHWLDLFVDLKRHRPEENVQYEAQITAAASKDGAVELTVNDERKETFDYCIFADGGQSFGRQYLFPGLEPKFTNTTIWRGILNHTEISQPDRILNNGTFYVTPKGHMLVYPVPNRASDNPLKDYKVNWLFYEHDTHSHPLFQGDMSLARRNIPKGQMPSPYIAYLHSIAHTLLPPFPQEVILCTKEPFIQAMHEVDVPQYFNNNTCLLGDASTMLRAHTAAGSTKAILDALAMEKYFSETDNTTLALQQWARERQRFGAKQFKMGQKLGELFVTNMPDWHAISKSDINEKWRELTADGVCWYAV
jgi:2-polyprenyl-6-methoxyphenol hydroxylase-like FAD-dependent oxidoreductase